MLLTTIAIIIAYIAGWAGLFKISQYSSSKYLRLPSQRDNFITAVHAFVLSILTLLYFLFTEDSWNYQNNMGPFMLQILMANIAFYAFSFINQAIAQKRIDLALAAHHLIVPIFYIFMLITPAFPEFLSFIIFFQFTGFVYNIHLILKETEDQLSKERSKIWYNYNYYSWVLFRFILMGIFTTIALYFEFTQWRFSISQRIFVLSGFVILYSFGVFWLYKIIQGRRKKAREAALAA